MNFKKYLKNEELEHNYSSKEDKIEHNAFNFIFEKIKSWAKSGGDFIQSMKSIWPENERGIKYFLPKSNFPSLSNLKVRFNVFNDESSVERLGDNVETLYIGVKSLIDGVANKDQNLINSSLQRIAGSLNHEVTHLHHKGASDGDGSIEAIVKYLVSPGEMRAHAKDYAYTWSNAFPKQQFDAQKFIKDIIPRLVQSKQKKAKNYLIAFNDPEKQKKYSNIANLKQAYEQIIKMVNGYVNYYNQQQSPNQQQNPTQQQSIVYPSNIKTWQQRQAFLNSKGVDTTNWSRGDLMKGYQNKWNQKQ